MEKDPPAGRTSSGPPDLSDIHRALAAAVQRVSIPITDFQAYGVPETGSHVVGRGVVVVPGWTRTQEAGDHWQVSGERLVYLRSSVRGPGGWMVQRRAGYARGWPPVAGEWRAGCAGYHEDAAFTRAKQVQGFDVGSSVRVDQDFVLRRFPRAALYQGAWEALRRLAILARNEARKYEAMAEGMTAEAKAWRGPSTVVEF